MGTELRNKLTLLLFRTPTEAVTRREAEHIEPWRRRTTHRQGDPLWLDPIADHAGPQREEVMPPFIKPDP